MDGGPKLNGKINHVSESTSLKISYSNWKIGPEKNLPRFCQVRIQVSRNFLAVSSSFTRSFGWKHCRGNSFIVTGFIPRKMTKSWSAFLQGDSEPEEGGEDLVIDLTRYRLMPRLMITTWKNIPD